VLRTMTTDLIERGLDAASLRQQALSSNVANVNTPGYKRVDVSFARVLGDTLGSTTRLATTRRRHMQGAESRATPQVTRDSSSVRLDGNNVDVESEMVAVAQNSIYYAALARQLSDRFLRLRLAITEGRK